MKYTKIQNSNVSGMGDDDKSVKVYIGDTQIAWEAGKRCLKVNSFKVHDVNKAPDPDYPDAA